MPCALAVFALTPWFSTFPLQLHVRLRAACADARCGRLRTLSRNLWNQETIQRHVYPALHQAHDRVDFIRGDLEPGRELVPDDVTEQLARIGQPACGGGAMH